MGLELLAEAEKTVVRFPGWSKPDPDDGYSYFNAPLAIGGVAEGGLFLFGGTYARIPDQHVTFELKCLTAAGRRWLPIMRVDWRSLKGGHTNMRKYRCPSPCQRRTTPTHFHAFDINWVDPPGKMRGPNLNCAYDIPEPLQTFEELRSYVGKAFRIKDIDTLLPPEWEYKLDL